MDVQTISDTASAPVAPLVYPTLPPAPTPAPQVDDTSSAPVAVSGSGAGRSVPLDAAAPPAASAGIDRAARSSAISKDQSLAPAVAKLFNAAEANVVVSFRVEHDPNEIITVFTDKSTGKQIVQFPSETLIALAQYFNKLAGAVLDQKA